MKINYLLAVAGMAAVLSLGTGAATAQERGRGNFDPEQMRQRMMERYREQLEIKGDDEWKVLQPRIEKVMEARREVGFGGGMRMFGPPPGQRREGGDEQGDRNRERRRFGPEPSPSAEALQKAIESKAGSEEVKKALAAYRADRKAKEEKLNQAQDELRKVLSVRQEASAVLMGLLE